MDVLPSRFRSPVELRFGPGISRQAGPLVAALGKRAIVVTDPGIVGAGLAAPALASLGDAGVAHALFDDVQPDPRMRSVAACVELIRQQGADVVVGIGGGSPMDVAKAAAIVAALGGDIRDYLGIDRIPRRGLPVVLVPTTAGTGSEASASVVLMDERDDVKRAAWSNHLLVELALLDPELTLGLPPVITVDTGIDALVHAVEAYVGRGASPLTDALALEAARLIAGNLRRAYVEGGDLAARSAMLMAASMAGLAFSSAGLGGVHVLAYPVAERYHVSHGRSNALFLAHVLAFNLPARREKAGALAAALGAGVDGRAARDASDAAVGAVTALMADLGIAPRLRDYGVPQERLDALAAEAVANGQRLLPNNPRALGVADAQTIYAAAW